LKVFQIINSPQGGGAEALVNSLNNSLKAKDVESYLIYFSKLPLYKVGASISLEQASFLSTSPRSPMAVLRLRKLMRLNERKFGHVIYHAHLTWPLYYVALASVGLNCTLVYTEHSTENKRRKIPLLATLERLIYGRYKRVIAISKGVEKSLVSWLGKSFQHRVVTIYNGAKIYEPKELKFIESKERIDFVSVGSLNKHKGFDVSIRALKALPKALPWTYTIVGEGPEREALQRLVNKNELGDKVNLVGWSDNVEEYLRNADIQLIPSSWEGFGLVAVEGMSTGLPVVASKVEGLNEVLGEATKSVFLVSEHSSVSSWSSAILDCINEVKYDRLGLAEASVSRASLFSLEKMVNGYIELYKRLADEAKG